MACEDSPICDFFSFVFLVLFLLSWLLQWTDFFAFFTRGCQWRMSWGGGGNDISWQWRDSVAWPSQHTHLVEFNAEICWMQLTAGNSEQMHVSVTPEFLSMRENWHSKCDFKLIFLNVIDMYVRTYIRTSRVVLDHNNSKLVFITLNNNLYSCSMPYECQPWVDITSDEFSQPSPSVSPTGSD